MILLDTNVISAVMSPTPPGEVVDWMNRQETVTLYVSTITIAEIGFGLWVMPDGKRRRRLREQFERYLETGFSQRILAFNTDAALLFGEVMGHRRLIGRPMSLADGQIASIARAHKMSVATRNVRDFDECGIEVVDPFVGSPRRGSVY